MFIEITEMKKLVSVNSGEDLVYMVNIPVVIGSLVI